MSSKSTTEVKDEESPAIDHWGQSVEHHDDPATGAGERCECLICGERFDIALVAGTDPHAADGKWEEFYKCACGAKGSLRVNGSSRTWTGKIGYLDE